MGKLLFLPVRLRDVNVPIRWRTKFRLKVSCLFPCAIEGGWFVRSYKMKQFTRHTFRTKCNINIHHFLKIGRHQSTRVSDHLHPHLPYVSCNLWLLEDMQFQFIHCLFLFFVLPNHQSTDQYLWKGGEILVYFSQLSCWRKEWKCKHQLISGIYIPDTSWKVVQVTDCLGSNSLYTYIYIYN